MTTPLIVVLLWLLWGGTFVATKLGLQVAPPSWFGTLRVASALLVLLPIVASRPAHERRHLTNLAVIGYGVLLGLANVAALIGFVNFAMVRADAALAAVVVYTQPLLVALAARVFFGEPLGARQVLGLVFGWLGVVAVVSGELARGTVPWSSLVLLFAAALSWGIGTLAFKAVPRGVPLWPLLLWQTLIGLLPLAVFATFEPPRLVWGWQLVVSLLFSGIGAGVAGFGLQFVLLRRASASAVGSWISAVPIVGAVLAVLLLDDRAHLTLLVGASAVTVGIYLVNSGRRRVPAVAAGGPP